VAPPTAPRPRRLAAWLAAVPLALLPAAPSTAAPAAPAGPAAPAAPAGAPASAAPYLGVNLTGVRDWSRDRLFADAMKSSRRFGSVDRPYDEAAPVDADGWPTGDAGVLVMADQPYIGGTYRLSCRGRGTIEVGGGSLRNQRWDPATRSTTAEVVVDERTRTLVLTFQGFAGGVKDVRLLRPGHGPHDLFNKDALARLARFSVLRGMDYAGTNGNPSRRWADRTLPGHASQAARRGHGASWEHLIQLCNTARKDCWLNVPDQVDDDYVTRLAQLVRYGSDGVTPYASPQASPAWPPLDPSLAVYVEFSNELWNFAGGFDQTERNLAAADAELQAGDPHHLAWDGNRERYNMAWRRIAWQAVRVSNLFRAVFGDAAMMTRVRPVLATQGSNEWIWLQGLRYVEGVWGPGNAFGNPPRPVNQLLYGLAGATYFFLPGADRPGLTLDQLFAGLDLTRTRGWVRALAAWAWPFGLKLLAYEGGHHLVSPANTGVLTAASYDPRMKGALLRMYQDWFEEGGDVHAYYHLAGEWDQHGQWGLAEWVDREDEAPWGPRTSLAAGGGTPKWAAVKQVLAGPRPAPTAGQLLPATLAAGDACLAGDGHTRGTSRLLEGRSADVGWLVRAPAAGPWSVATTATSAAGATLRLEVDGVAVASWTIPPGGSAQALGARLPLGAGLHGVRVRLAAGRSVTLRPLVVSGP
jgi:hypothetical protein